MLLQFPCGDCVRCNGLFDGRTSNPRNFSEEADPISRHRRDSTTSATSATRLPIASPHRRADGSCTLQALRWSSPSCTSMTSLRGTFHHHRLTVERLAVQRRRCRRDGFSILHDFPAAPPSAATACSTATLTHFCESSSSALRRRAFVNAAIVAPRSTERLWAPPPRTLSSRSELLSGLVARRTPCRSAAWAVR